MPRFPSRSLAVVLGLVIILIAPAPPAAAGRGTPAPDALGPFAVGRSTFDAVDPTRDGGRVLTVDVWYPVDPADAGGGLSRYDLLLTGIDSEVAFDSAPPSSRGPFPLVVFSHGNGGIRFQSFFLCEALASHGFVVAAPDHTGNTAIDLLIGTADSFAKSAVDRPLDVSFLITTMLERSADPTDELHGRIDARRIGVSGHSFGGFTSLAVAAGFVLAPPDPRVRAIVPIAPASSIFDDDALASIGIPTLILGGTLDETTPVEPESARPYALIPARPRYRVDVLDAGHGSFTEICEIIDALVVVGIPPAVAGLLLSELADACGPDLIPIEEAQRLTNLYAIAFLKRFVALDPRYERWLAPGFAKSRRLAVDLFRAAGGGKKPLTSPWPAYSGSRRATSVGGRSAAR
jgi:predicted dienelactone hydrolase